MANHSVFPWYDEELVDKVEIRDSGKRVERFPGFDTIEDIRRKLRDLGHYGTLQAIAIGHDGRPMKDPAEIDVRPGRSRTSNLFTASSHTRPPRPAGGLDQHALLEHEREMQARVEETRRQHEERIAKEREHLASREREAAEAREKAAREAAELRERVLAEAAKAREEAVKEAASAKEAAAKEAAEVQRRTAEVSMGAQGEAYKMAIEAARAAADAKEAAARQTTEVVRSLAEEQIKQMRASTEAQLKELGNLFSRGTQTVTDTAARSESMLVTAFSGQVQQAAAEVALWRERCDRIERDAARREKDLEEKFSAKEAAMRAEMAATLEREKSALAERERMLIDRLEREKRELLLREDTYREENRRLLDRLENMRTEVERTKEQMILSQINAAHRAGTENEPSKRIRELRDLVEITKAAGGDPAKVLSAEIGMNVDDEPEEDKKPSMMDTLLTSILSGALTQRPQLASVPSNPRTPAVLETEPL